MSCLPPAIGFTGLATPSSSWLASVKFCAATGSELGEESDEASGVDTSGLRSTGMMPLLLAVAFVAVRFPPALDDEVCSVWEFSQFPAGVVAGLALLLSLW